MYTKYNLLNCVLFLLYYDSHYFEMNILLFELRKEMLCMICNIVISMVLMKSFIPKNCNYVNVTKYQRKHFK